MAVYVVTYDLKKTGQNYTCIIQKLQALKAHHAQGSVWMANYSGTEIQLRDHLSPCLDENDELWVGLISNRWASSHMADTKTWLDGNL